MSDVLRSGHRSTRRSRSALAITETDERLIAAAAIIGEAQCHILPAFSVNLFGPCLSLLEALTVRGLSCGVTKYFNIETFITSATPNFSMTAFPDLN